MHLRRLASCATFGVVLGMGGALARADDHLDSPSAVNRPEADLTSLYAWTSGPSLEAKVNLILGVQHSELSTDIQYVFHVASGPSYGNLTDEVLIICQLDARRSVECWVGDQLYLRGDATSPAGLLSPDGRLRIYAGPRDDPFFFNQAGYEEVLSQLRQDLTTAPRDAAFCPTLPSATTNQLLTRLTQGLQGGPPVNHYRRDVNAAFGQITALILRVDKSLLTKGGDVLAIWASTHAR
jgi:hypothetical protein